jgi:hypothetical protein
MSVVARADLGDHSIKSPAIAGNEKGSFFLKEGGERGASIFHREAKGTNHAKKPKLADRTNGEASTSPPILDAIMAFMGLHQMRHQH